MKLNGATGFELITKFDTNDLCCAIAGGIINGTIFYCGSYTGSCILYTLYYDDEQKLWYEILLLVLT